MLRMKALLSVAVFAAIAAPLPAQAAEYFQHDGNSYAYTTSVEDELIRIQGEVQGTGQRFDLWVAKTGKVTGEFGGRDVDFRVRRNVRDRLAAKLAAKATDGLQISAR